MSSPPISDKEIDRYVGDLNTRLSSIFHQMYEYTEKIEVQCGRIRSSFSDEVTSKLHNYLNYISDKKDELDIEVRRLEGIKKDIDAEFLSIPHKIVDDEYIDYYIYIDKMINTIIYKGKTYTIPEDMRNYRVFGNIVITVKRDGRNSVIRYQGNVYNYIHRSAGGNGLCLGNLDMNYLTEVKITELLAQMFVANLDSPNNHDYPYRQLNLLVSKLIDEGEHNGEKRTWRV